MAAWLYAITQRWLLERNPPPPIATTELQWQHQRQAALQEQALAYMDDLTLWGKTEHLRPTYEFYRDALAQGGLMLKPEKCQLMAQTAIPWVPVQPCDSITSLGYQPNADFEIAIGASPEQPVEK